MMKKPKIAFVTPIYLPAKLSGSAFVIKNLAEELAQRGFNCSVITSNGLNTRFWYDPIFGKKINNTFEVINRVKVYRLECKQLLSFLALVLVRFFKSLLPKTLFNKLELFYCGPNLAGLTKILSCGKFNVIYSSPLPAYLNVAVIKACKKIIPRPKLILGACFHDLLPDYHNPELVKFIKKFDLIHVFSNGEKEDIKKAFKISENKFAVIPAFLRLQTMKKSDQIKDKVENFKKKFNLKNKKIILFAGGKIEMKGIYNLLNVVGDLSQKDPSLVLITIGSNNIPRWKKIIQEKKPAYLIDLGYVSEQQKEIIFSACDIYCMPSICESFGLSYLEAWQKEKPVIGANIPVVKQLINKASGGLLVEFGNEKQLKTAIQKLIKDPKLSRRLGKCGLRAVKSTYGSQKLIPKFETIFQSPEI